MSFVNMTLQQNFSVLLCAIFVVVPLVSQVNFHSSIFVRILNMLNKSQLNKGLLVLLLIITI